MRGPAAIGRCACLTRTRPQFDAERRAPQTGPAPRRCFLAGCAHMLSLLPQLPPLGQVRSVGWSSDVASASAARGTQVAHLANDGPNAIAKPMEEKGDVKRTSAQGAHCSFEL